VTNCFADPKRTTCLSKSYPTSTEFEIEIERLPLEAMSKQVYVEITGQRSDYRSRSASPPNRSTSRSKPRPDDAIEGQYTNDDERQLPEFVSIWAFPNWRKGPIRRIEWLSHVVDAQTPPAGMVKQSLHHTGQSPVLIGRIDLGRRSTAKDVSHEQIRTTSNRG
jgi:hypothetical protein